MVIIYSFPGLGKTLLLIKIVITKLLRKLDIKIIIIVSLNQVINVFVKQIN